MEMDADDREGVEQGASMECRTERVDRCTVLILFLFAGLSLTLPLPINRHIFTPTSVSLLPPLPLPH